jgi:hypothetical protein
MNEPKFIAHEEMVRAIGPVTKGELDRLKQDREQPSRLLELTPGGATESIIRRFESERRSVRESYIGNRLERADGRALVDFAFARMRGKAGFDFDREK